MTKRLITLPLMIILGACSSFMKKDVKVYVEGGKYGWYFVFIENLHNELALEESINVDLTNQNFDIIKLGDPAKYELKIYDKDTKKELSKKMKLIGYRGSFKKLQCCVFYYPDPEKYPDAVFDSDTNDPEWDIKRDIDRKGGALLDTIVKKHNIKW